MDRKKLLVCAGLLFIFGINFYLYRAEFTALIDPNDNIFQYALIDDVRNIWEQVFAGKLSPMYLLDSWNERWAEGFALTNYYSHLPQAVLGLFGGYKLFVIVRTLMLICLPLMFFFGSRILGVSWLASLLVSLFSQTIFTDGLYGIDVTSFVWRGWGLSAQLMAMFFLPVAFAYAVDYLEHRKNLAKAVLFNFLVASSHFGIFSLALLGYGLYWVVNINSLEQFKYLIFNINSKIQRAKLKAIIQPSLVLFGLILFALAYFIVPFFLQSQYRNYSVWDPIWKFDSWGIRQTIIWFLNGDLFDFNRLPIITYAVIFGVFAGLVSNNKLIRYLCVLFTFYLVLFLGRATWGDVLNLMPGFAEFHQHRVIVMVQFTGIFIGAWLINLLLIRIKELITGPVPNSLLRVLATSNGLEKSLRARRSPSFVTPVILFVFLIGIYFLEKPLVDYARDNSVWIDRANKAYQRDLPDYEKIKSKLASLPQARVYVGRPGNWGKQFTVGESPLYMVLSRDGYPTIGFLPESWSPNSDPEQFFNDSDINFYNLYNVGYSILPENIKPPEFAELLFKEGKYSLFQIKTTGWFDLGSSSLVLTSKKTNVLNPTRLWFESDFFKNKDYPLINFDKLKPDGKRWHIRMTDKNNWINLNDGKERNLWQANPFSVALDKPGEANINLIKRQTVLSNGYTAKLEVKKDCSNCILVLKQSFHPNWEIRLNGQRVKTFPVFPFFIGIELNNAGSYEVIAEYKPGIFKTVLVGLEFIVFAAFLYLYITKKRKLN